MREKTWHLHNGDCLDWLATIPSDCAQLIVTSPPYNIGKEYESRVALDQYVDWQSKVIAACARVLKPGGSLCWQVGNYVKSGSVVPLDIALHPAIASQGLTLRNRIVWHFEHGLHCKNRFSGRYETVMWYTKGDNYTFNLDPVRVPQKYPNKRHFKGPKAGQLSGNPLGKNPGDVWNIPNVKSNHVEKTDHPCQFPVELIERLVLSMTNRGDTVVDPFAGTGTSIIAAILHGRIGWGAEIDPRYSSIAASRISAALDGTLRTRPMSRPVYDPTLPSGGQKRKTGAHPEQQLSLQVGAAT